MNHPDTPQPYHPSLDTEEIARVRSPRGPIFSLYLDLRQPGNLVDRFNALLGKEGPQKWRRQETFDNRVQFRHEANHIRRWLEDHPVLEAQGLAIFSSHAAGFWQALLLPVPLRDRLAVSDRAYTPPLDIVAQEYPRLLVILLSNGEARLVEVSMGAAREIDRLTPVPVTGDGESALEQYARAVIERAEEAWLDNEYSRLVIGGSDAPMAALRERMPTSLLDYLDEDFDLRPQARLEEVSAEISRIEEALEHRTETLRVQELLSKADSAAAVLGLEQTLLHLRSKKICLLVVEEDFQLPGGVCPNCGFLSDDQQSLCLICGMALRPEPDIIENALQQALNQGAEIEILRAPDTRAALSTHGHIGALLREPVHPEDQAAAASHLPLTSSGQVQPEAQHDEAIEESFPASDPPSWTSG